MLLFSQIFIRRQKFQSYRLNNYQNLTFSHFTSCQIYQQQQLSLNNRNILMGANSSHHQSFRPFIQDQWQQIPLNSYTNIKDPTYGSNFQIFANKLNSSIQLQKYQLYFNTYRQYCSYKQFIYWRNSNRHIIQVKYVREPEKQNICNTFYNGSIYLDRAPIRLVQIQDISLQEGLYILQASVQGFQKLYQKYRYFQIEPQLICFTREGYVKVWINKNLSKNYPDYAFNQNKQKDYSIFIKKVTYLVQKLIDFEHHESISSFIERQQIENPYENMLKTLQRYVSQTKVKIPRYLNSIKQLCNKSIKKGSKKLSRRGSFAPNQTNSRYQSLIIQTNSKNIQTEQDVQDVFTIPINSPIKEINRTPIQELKFTKKSTSFVQPHKICHTSRAPTVRFSYRTTSVLPSSPIRYSLREVPLQVISKSVSTLTGNERIHSSQSERFFLKNKTVHQSADQSWQLDPDIAADLAKIVNHQQ